MTATSTCLDGIPVTVSDYGISQCSAFASECWSTSKNDVDFTLLQLDFPEKKGPSYLCLSQTKGRTDCTQNVTRVRTSTAKKGKGTHSVPQSVQLRL